MPLSTTALPPVPAGLPALVTGKTVLALGVVPDLEAEHYGVPYQVGTIQSAATTFGYGRFTRALGELARQGAPSVLALAVPHEDDFPGVFTALADTPYNIVVPVGLPATPSRVATFGTFAYQREQAGRPIQIVMGADPSPGVSALVSAPTAAQAGWVALDQSGLRTLFSRYFVMTLDQVIINPNLPAEYQVDAAPSVAGLLATTPVQHSITYQSLAGLELVGGYDQADAQTLAAAGYLVLTTTTRHGVVPFLGVTATSADPTSQNYSPFFHRLTTLRVANYIATVLQEKTDQYIGTPNITAARRIIHTTMRELQDQGIILNYDLNITIRQLVGTIAVEVAFLPHYETQMIAVVSQIRLVRG